jgi:hypothetical protein
MVLFELGRRASAAVHQGVPMPRTFQGPLHHPLAAAVLIDLLYGYAEGADPTTPLQKPYDTFTEKGGSRP